MLLRLYSETNLLLDDITFHPGINIILGKYSSDRKARGINGIGKSTLIRLISFLFLSESAEKLFLQPRYDFLRDEDHTISLEFAINNESYLIKRSFYKTSSVFFGRSKEELEEYTKQELKTIFANKLFPFDDEQVFFEGNRYGTLMHFFIKDDLEHQRRAQPLEFLPYNANSREIAIYNFFLLNLPTINLIRYDGTLKEYEDKTKAVRILENKISTDTGKSVEEYKSERIKIEQKIELLEKSLKDYNFFEVYKELESDLISLNTQISEKLNTYYAHQNQLRKIKESYQFNEEIDIKQIQKMYNEILSSFGDLVKKSLDEIQQFKSEIVENRNKFLISKEKQLKEVIEKVLREISELEKRRSEIYKKLEEKGALESIKNTYQLLIKEKANLENSLQTLRNIDDIQDSLTSLEINLSELKRDILSDLKDLEERVDKLRTLFQEILAEAIFLDENFTKAYFDIAKKQRVRKNQLPFHIEIEIPKADALGQSRLKIVAYDLMVFLYNIRIGRRLPDFLIHDGVFHGIEIKTMVNTLNYMYHQSLESFSKKPFQYILTFNEDEIYIPPDRESLYGKLDFDWEKMVIAKFEDIPQKMIFKRVFS